MKENIKSGVEWLFNLNNRAALRPRDGQRVFLFLSPQYLNYGDHAIALAELDLLKKHFGRQNVVDVNYSLFTYWPDAVKAAVAPQDIIVVTGGGFMGSLWPENEALTEKIIDLFPNNRLIFAPQTLFYHQTVQAAADRDRLKEKLEKHGRFFFYARDEQSCTVMEYMGFQRDKDYQLFPDFVLFLKEAGSLKLSCGTPMFCLRHDGEAQPGVREAVMELMSRRYGDQLREIHMARDHMEIPTVMRRVFVRKKLQTYAGASVLVTDRLHAMLFAASTGTPCVALDNVSGKVSGVHHWIESLDYVKVARNVEELPACLDHVSAFMEKAVNRAAFGRLQQELENAYAMAFLSELKR